MKMSKYLVLSFLLVALTALTACHTVRGVGQDVSATGHVIQRSTY